MKWLHNLLKGVSLTGALFAFQACYGIAEPPLYEEWGEAPMSFKVVSQETGAPLEGIGIGFDNYDAFAFTGADGLCHVDIPYRRNLKGPVIHFKDLEGNYASKDTTLNDLREREILVKMKPVQ